MLVVAGITLTNLAPRVWDPVSAYYLPKLKAIMVSYADFVRMPGQRKAAMEKGLRAHLGVPSATKVFLDNGAFFQMRSGEETPFHEYEEFVTKAKPDWWPIPRDFIPAPQMHARTQHTCFKRTMVVNKSYEHDGFVPVIHFGKHLAQYIEQIQANDALSAKPSLALGGLVPNLLRSRNAHEHSAIVEGLATVRSSFAEKNLHVFGIGGTATLHLAALIGFDSVDSSGWRNRAARGIVQLPGSGDRVVANLGSWRGRKPNRKELKALKECGCPSCRQFGTKGLRKGKLAGFENRSAHNLWILLEEAEWIAREMANGSYASSFRGRLSNSTYLPLLEGLVDRMSASSVRTSGAAL